MRFSTFVPLAVLAAAGSFAVARPVDEFMFKYVYLALGTENSS